MISVVIELEVADHKRFLSAISIDSLDESADNVNLI